MGDLTEFNIHNYFIVLPILLEILWRTNCQYFDFFSNFFVSGIGQSLQYTNFSSEFILQCRLLMEEFCKIWLMPTTIYQANCAIHNLAKIPYSVFKFNDLSIWLCMDVLLHDKNSLKIPPYLNANIKLFNTLPTHKILVLSLEHDILTYHNVDWLCCFNSRT
jgi:hypothetical protein